MKQLFLSILLITSFISTNLSAQSLAKELVDFCLNSDAKTLVSDLKKLEKRETISFDEIVYHIDYEIIENFQAQLFEIKNTEKVNANTSSISTYRLRIIIKNNELIFYELDQGHRNQKGIWITKSLITRHCGTSLYYELDKKYVAIYGVKIDLAQIFSTDFVYFIPQKASFFNCPFYEKREILTKVVENQDTITLLNWLKSGNVPLQLYAIEGIFQLTEKGISFPPNTWNWIELVQKKDGNVRRAVDCGSEQFPIYTLVRQIKAKHRKAKRMLKRK